MVHMRRVRSTRRGSAQTRRPGRRVRQRQAAEASSGALVEVEVTSLGRRGDGLAVGPDGEKVFIAKSLPGDRVRVRIGPAHGDGRTAEIVAILRPGPGRTEAPCPHFARCGGCALQHLRDDDYIAWKVGRLRLALDRAGLGDTPVASPVRIPPGARRRATFTAVRAAAAGSRVCVGFAAARSNDVIDLSVCPVLDPEIAAVVPMLRELLDGTLAPGGQTRVAVSRLDGGLDVVFDWPEPPSASLRERWSGFAREAGLARLSWRRAPAAPAEPVVQHRPVAVVHGDCAVAVPPDAFLQASSLGEAALTQAVLAAMAQANTAADLFCGLGPFALALAAAGKRVHAVDGDEAAVAALAAAVRGKTGLSTERRNLFARPLEPDELRRFDAVAFDPPRAGARAQAMFLADSPVPVVVAISCNLETFIRDARLLVGGGFRLETVTPVDQFLWSPHLELAATFRR